MASCSDYKLDRSEADTGAANGAVGDTTSASEGGTTSGDDSGLVTSDTDTGPELPPPVWYALDAEVVIGSGAITDATFRVRVVGEDTTQAANCVGERVLVSAVELDLTPDQQIYQWWSVLVAPDDGECEGADALPEEFYFGVGAMHVDVLPALTRDGLDATALADTLYGAYASIPVAGSICGGESTSACVFGYAGTPQDFAGETEAVINSPVPDGVYGVTAAFYLPVD